MSRTTLHKLLMTTAFVASFSIASAANAATTSVTVDGDIGATAPTAGSAGTTGASATAGTAGEAAVSYGGAGVDATADTAITGANGGAGGDDTDGDGSGTSDAGAGAAGGAGVTFNAQTTPTLTIETGIAVTGGNGGNGGDVSANNGNGGAGANGGAGVIASGAGTITIEGTGSIVGGNGGDGGTKSGTGTNGAGGNGANGVTVSANTAIDFDAAGSITGGDAGTGPGAAGTTGAGITASGTATLTITGEDGTIESGDSGAGKAVALTGTGNLSNEATIGSAAGTGDAVDLDSAGTTALITNTGTFQTGTGNALDVTSGDTLTSLANTAGVITAAGGKAVNVAGTLTGVTNTGTISATGAAGVAVNVSGDLGSITNTGGTITSANTSTTTSGTVVIGADLAGVTLTGGTISNTGSGNAIVVNGVDQTGAIASSATVTSSGSAVHFQNAAGSFTNTGTVTGDITSSAHTKVQTITNTSGSIEGDITLDAGADVLTLTAGTIEGAVDMGADGDTVTLNGGTLTGNVNMGAGNDTFTYANADSATGLVGTLGFAAGTNTFDINEDMTTGGAITTTAGNATNATVAADKLLTAAHDVDLADGTLVVNGTVQINSGKTVSADNDTLGASGKYVFQIGTATVEDGAGVSVGDLDATNVHGYLDLTGNTNALAFATADDIEVTMASTSTVSDGALIHIASGGAAGTAFSGEEVEDDSFLYDFTLYRGTDADLTLTDDTTSDLFLRASRASASASAGFSASAIAANTALSNLETSTDTQFDEINDNLAAASTAAEYNEIVESLTPAYDNGTSAAATDAGLQVVDLAAGRLSGVRSENSGSEMLDNRVWVQAFGSKGDQGALNGADSYDTKTYGVAVGGDGKIAENVTLGAALSYGRTNIDSDNANTTETDIDSYQLTAYGDYTFGEGTFVEGVVAYAWNNIDSDRHNVGGVSGLTANANYDAQTYAARAAVGHDFGAMDGVMITPKAFAEYVSYNPDRYTETGAGGANLTVDGDTSDQLNLGAAVEVSNTYAGADGSLLKPSVNVGYKYDVINDNVDSTTTFAAGGGSFIATTADKEPGTLTAGLGLDYYDAGNYQLTLDYGYEHKEEYNSHAGVARASYRF